jgi:hypothetical protein
MDKFIDPVEVPNPSGKLPDVLRTSVEYPRELHGYLYRLRSKAGTTQTTANILLNKLADELKRNNFEYDPDAYELAVANCTIVLGGTAAGTPAGPDSARTVKAVVGNDGRGTVRLGRKPKGTVD